MFPRPTLPPTAQPPNVVRHGSRRDMASRLTRVLSSAALLFLPALVTACGATRQLVETPPPDVVPPVAAPPLGLVSVHVAWGPSLCNGRLLDREVYVVCHSGEWRIPRWVVYHLTAADLTQAVRRRDHFRADEELPPGERAELADYRGSGFSRGHMAPADDFLRSFEAMDATFLLSNMAPQVQALNGGRWRVLESEVQSLAAAHGSIWVVTGPLFLGADGRPTRPDRFIGTDQVAVPTHFFKVVLCVHPSGEQEVFAFIVPHTAGLPGPTLRYAVSVDEVEELTGLDFLAPLADAEEARFEGQVTFEWPIR